MTQQNELAWVGQGKSKIGTHEISGAKHSPIILSMLEVVFQATGQKQWIKDDETAWCGTFVAYCMVKADLVRHVPKDFYRAKAWATVGTAINKPAYGCIVVFNRNGGGHVGIVVGKDRHGNLMVLGGNQSDAVNIKPFSTSRVIAYRWCGTQTSPLASRYDLPVLSSDGKVSTNEA
ncbi:TIGR02594 family protein [Acinetobacter modestus]|uniref:TIGR02594 family protein n=1 Tax=Acinetobacter modestus TaxID=1776740 RepID=UPI003016B4AB